MSGKISKVFKWGASAVRVAKAKAAAGGRLRVASGKPLYLGKGARVRLGKGATCTMGAGVYLSPGCAIDVADDAHLVIEDGVYMNEACRVTVVDGVRIGANTLFGPNVQVYDHDHKFDWGGVRSELRSKPTLIGKSCWLCANSVITRGCSIADRSLVSANSVVTHDLADEGALYAGAPARLIKRYD